MCPLITPRHRANRKLQSQPLYTHPYSNLNQTPTTAVTNARRTPERHSPNPTLTHYAPDINLTPTNDDTTAAKLLDSLYTIPNQMTPAVPNARGRLDCYGAPLVTLPGKKQPQNHSPRIPSSFEYAFRFYAPNADQFDGANAVQISPGTTSIFQTTVLPSIPVPLKTVITQNTTPTPSINNSSLRDEPSFSWRRSPS